jgi:hypothetical protein
LIAIALAAAPAALAAWSMPAAAPLHPAIVVKVDNGTDPAFRQARAEEDATLSELQRLGLAEVRDPNAPQSDVFVKFRPAGAPILLVPDPFEPSVQRKLSPSA